jgi:hypothetical protein
MEQRTAERGAQNFSIGSRSKMTESAFISVKPQRKSCDNPSKMAACKICGSLFIARFAASF